MTNTTLTTIAIALILIDTGLTTTFFIVNQKTIKKMDTNEQAKLTELSGKVDTLTTGVNTLVTSAADTKAQLQALLSAEAGTDQTAAIQAIIDKVDADTASVAAAIDPAAPEA